MRFPPTPVPRAQLPSGGGSPRTPPAIWAAMARQGQWKSWALVLAFALCALEVLVMLKLARKEPDIVLIAPDGKSTYLSRAVAEDALVRFLDEQRQLPSDVTVFHFTRDFIQRFFAVNSASYDASFREALGMLSAGFRERIVQEAEKTKLLEGVRASRTRAVVSIESLDIVERSKDALHLRGVLRRRAESPGDGTLVSLDCLRVDIYESIVPRRATHPDGLLIGQFSARAEKLEPGASCAPVP